MGFELMNTIVDTAQPQTGLFGEIALSPAKRRQARAVERRRKAKLAYDATSAAWKRETYRIAVVEFLPAHETFVFEELSEFYNEQAKHRGLPKTVNGKAFAGLQRILIVEGKIEKVRGLTGVRSNGQIGPIYRSNLFRNVS